MTSPKGPAESPGNEYDSSPASVLIEQFLYCELNGRTAMQKSLYKPIAISERRSLGNDLADPALGELALDEVDEPARS